MAAELSTDDTLTLRKSIESLLGQWTLITDIVSVFANPEGTVTAMWEKIESHGGLEQMAADQKTGGFTLLKTDIKTQTQFTNFGDIEGVDEDWPRMLAVINAFKASSRAMKFLVSVVKARALNIKNMALSLKQSKTQEEARKRKAEEKLEKEQARAQAKAMKAASLGTLAQLIPIIVVVILCLCLRSGNVSNVPAP